MAETKEPAIKLFGKTIPLQDTPLKSSNHCSTPADVHLHDIDNGDRDDDEDSNSSFMDSSRNNYIEDMEKDTIQEEREIDKIDQDKKTFQTNQIGVLPEVSDKSTSQDTSLGCTDYLEALSGADEKAVGGESLNPEEEKTEMSSSQENTSKKPDKILPCPRCSSMETKFCYYNNYNVNQPRHFCKNCQRYWTAGGTMRNVPVGAGRRRNKNSVPHYRHLTIPEALHNTRPDIPNAFHTAVPANSTVLAFSSDVPLCESMTSILNLAEKTERKFPPNGFQKPEELKIPIQFDDGLNSKDDAGKSTLKEPAAHQCPSFAHIPCYPGVRWPYPWNSTQCSPPITAPPFCPNGFAIPFYHAPPYWGCNAPGTWNIPWMAQPSPVSHSNSSSGPNSPLGKHTRDGNILTPTNPEEKEMDENGSEKSIWIPKTFRIDDPGEVAKSSIWTTLEMKNSEKLDSIGRGSSLFKAFQSKRDEGNPLVETSVVQQANPAALSRSQNFQENS